MDFKYKQPRWSDIPYKAPYERPKIYIPVFSNVIELQPELSSEKYFSGILEKRQQEEQQKQRLEQMTEIEKLRYGLQREFPQEKYDLEKETKKLDAYKRNREIYNQLKEMLSESVLHNYSVNIPTQKNPEIHFIQLIKDLARGKTGSIENKPTQRLIRLLYYYKYNEHPTEEKTNLLKIDAKGADYVIGLIRGSRGKLLPLKKDAYKEVSTHEKVERENEERERENEERERERGERAEIYYEDVVEQQRARERARDEFNRRKEEDRLKRRERQRRREKTQERLQAEIDLQRDERALRRAERQAIRHPTEQLLLEDAGVEESKGAM
jgi:hypothetical protein